jgi:hypothetical protein
MKMWLKNEDLCMAFLVEVDTSNIDTPEDYQIEEYETIIPKTHKDKKKRIIALRKSNMKAKTKTREDLISPDFPSKWVEWENTNSKNTLVCGFYREWTQVGRTTDRDQCELLETLADQISIASSESKDIIMLGDANLDSEKWNQTNYRHFKVATEMQSALTRNGLKNVPIGKTFLAEQTRTDGKSIESALDHVYIKEEMEGRVNVTKGNMSATDHLP